MIQAETPFCDPGIQARWRRFFLLVGPPGAGKVAWARKLAAEQNLWMGVRGIDDVWRASGLDPEQTRGLADDNGDRGLRFSRIFRAPHHSASVAGLTGSVKDGWCVRPGELSLAHGGVLLLDELPEWRHESLRVVLDAVRAGSVGLSFGRGEERCALKVPACFSLVCSMNPCPCGFRGVDDGSRCACTPAQVERYRARAAEFEEFCELVELRRSDRVVANG